MFEYDIQNLFNWFDSVIITLIGWKPKHAYPPFIDNHIRTFILLSFCFRTQNTKQMDVTIPIVVPQLWMHLTWFYGKSRCVGFFGSTYFIKYF